MSSVWEGTRTEAFCKGAELGAERERQRIIALLEGECFCHSGEPYDEYFCDACQYVALIKGENE
jgi:hypothetical protein